MGKRKNWTAAQKLSLIKDCEEIGVDSALRKHEVSLSTYYNWKKKFELGGKAGLSLAPSGEDPELRRLREENLRLKRIVADKELALQIQSELLKKNALSQQ